MLKNYLTIAIRTLSRHKLYTVINVSGLAIAIAFCILAMLFVREEHSFDQFHQNADNLYRVVRGEWKSNGFKGEPESPLPIADFLNTYPEVEAAVRIESTRALLQYEDKALQKVGVEAYSNIFDLFTFPFIAGDAPTALQRPNSIIITKHLAQQLFGDKDPMDKAITLRQGNPETYVVTGVIHNIPSNSSLQFDYAIPHPLSINQPDKLSPTKTKNISPPPKDQRWYHSDTAAYVLLKPSVDADAFAKKFTPAVLEHSYKTTYHLQPITRMHLDTQISGATNPQYGYILIGISIIVLLIACINFMNLSIGASVTRAKEVGVRKVMGAKRTQLIKQFWGESIVLCALSVTLGLALTELFLPAFNTLANKNLIMIFDAQMGLTLFALIFTVGLLAGIYPALVLSGFDPVNTLKGTLRLGGGNWIAQGLVVTQFALSIGFVIGTLMMSHQLNFLQTKNMSYQKDAIVVIQTHSNKTASHRLLDTYRQALSTHPNIKNVTGTRSLRRGGRRTVGPRDQIFEAPYLFVDHDYLSTMDIELTAGRNFSPDRPTDQKQAVIVNETLLKHFNVTDPIGQNLPGRKDKFIIGVVKDFHYDTLYDQIKPMVMEYKNTYRFILVRINTQDITNTVTTLKDTWQTVAPDLPFQHSFLDEELNRHYQSEMRWRSIIQYAAGFAIFIACLGIFGLTTLTVNRRIKEIGIRKILGASVSSVVFMISKSFVKLVIIANLIAWPLAYYTMEQWLQNFAYRIDQEMSTFIIGGLLALCIACATVSIQALKAARANPIDALRNE
jgi:putative ABC transport system permease protein